MLSEIDSLRAYCFTHFNNIELQSEFELHKIKKLSNNFMQQLLQEVPEKNLNLIYFLIERLSPMFDPSINQQQLQSQFLGEKLNLQYS